MPMINFQVVHDRLVDRYRPFGHPCYIISQTTLEEIITDRVLVRIAIKYLYNYTLRETVRVGGRYFFVSRTLETRMDLLDGREIAFQLENSKRTYIIKQLKIYCTKTKEKLFPDFKLTWINLNKLYYVVYDWRSAKTLEMQYRMRILSKVWILVRSSAVV